MWWIGDFIHGNVFCLSKLDFFAQMYFKKCGWFGLDFDWIYFVWTGLETLIPGKGSCWAKLDCVCLVVFRKLLLDLDWIYLSFFPVFDRLEDPEAEEVKDFVQSQVKLTESVLEKCETREKLREKITKLFDHPRYYAPFRRGDKYFYFHNTGLQAQNVLYVQVWTTVWWYNSAHNTALAIVLNVPEIQVFFFPPSLSSVLMGWFIRLH